jgi:hypothetical protein
VQTIVLARTIRETYAWARAQERNLRSVRHVPNAASISGRNFDRIVELPSYSKRADRHAVNAALRQLKRRLPHLKHDYDADWVMPEPPKKVEKVHLDPATFLFSNAPVPTSEKPLGDLWFDAVAAEADEDYSVEDDSSSDDEVAYEATDTAEVTSEVTFEAVEPVQEPETSDDQAIEKLVEAKGTGNIGTDELNTPKPKRKGRRTNEQKAYDEALAAWETNGGTIEAVEEARAALKKRHPDDERLQGHSTDDSRDEPDLDF